MLNCQISIITTGTTEGLKYISNVNGNLLVAGSKGFIGKCNGGCNTITQLATPVFPNSSYNFSITRPDTNALYMTASSSANLNLLLWKSINGGSSWSKKFDTINPSMYKGALVFFDSLNGICFVDNWKTIRTSNGLSNYTFGVWNNYGPINAKSFGDSIVMVNSCSANCGLQISHNRGNTWGYGFSSPTRTVKDYTCLNKDTVLCLIASNNGPFLLRSFDAGLNWEQKDFASSSTGTVQTGLNPMSIYVKNRTEIFVVGRSGIASSDKGIVLYTKDLGNTWSQFLTPFEENLTGLDTLDSNNLIICGDSGLLFKLNLFASNFTDISENSQHLNLIQVFPNPCTEQLNIHSNTVNNKIVIFDVLGNTISEITTNTNSTSLPFNYSSGVYFLKVENEFGTQLIKFLKI